MLIFADQFAEVLRFESPPLAPLQMFQTFLVSMGDQMSISPLIWFSVTVPVGSCLQGWFPFTGLPWIPPCLGLKCSGPLPTLKAPVPKLILATSSNREQIREFKKLRQQLHGKRHIKIELYLKLSFLRLFHVDHVVQNRQSALSLAWHKWFSCKGKD